MRASATTVRVLLVLLLGTMLLGCHHRGRGGAADAPPVDGAPPDGPPPSGGTEDLRIAFVYTNDVDGDGARSLYVATRSGRIVDLSRAIGADASVGSFALSPDGAFVAFAVDAGSAPGLYVSPLSRAAPVLVSDPADDPVDGFAWSPDGTTVAYRSRIAGAYRAFVVARDGTGRSDVAGTGATILSVPRFAKGGDRLLLTSDRLVTKQRELFSVRADGSGETELSRTASPAADSSFVTFSPSPDGEKVAFRSDPSTPGVFDLFVIDAAGGGSPLRLTDGAGGVHTNEAIWSPDSSHLLFYRVPTGGGLPEIWLVSAAGGDATRVAGDFTSPPLDLAWTPDGRHFLWREGNDALRSADLAGTVVELARPGFLAGFSVSGDSTAVAWRHAPSSAGPFELSVRAVDGSGDAVRIAVDGSVAAFAWGPAPQEIGGLNGSVDTIPPLGVGTLRLDDTNGLALVSHVDLGSTDDVAPDRSWDFVRGDFGQFEIGKPGAGATAPSLAVTVTIDGLVFGVIGSPDTGYVPEWMGTAASGPRIEIGLGYPTTLAPEQVFGASAPVTIHFTGQGEQAGNDFTQFGGLFLGEDGGAELDLASPTAFGGVEIQPFSGTLDLGLYARQLSAAGEHGDTIGSDDLLEGPPASGTYSAGAGDWFLAFEWTFPSSGGYQADPYPVLERYTGFGR